VTRIWISDEERQQIARMLRAGHSALDVHRRTGRSPAAVRGIRDQYGLPGAVAGPRVDQTADDESYGAGSGDPWIPPSGYDLYAERPHQARWLALLHAADDEERAQLRRVVCRALGLSVFSSEYTIVQTLIADRHTADELAAMYLAEAGVR
jgi:hypothetical protein